MLTFDELEAIRLKDFEGMEQKKAAKKMNISQPTFHRLLVSARKKLAEALVNGKAIKIQGGDYKMVRPRGRGMGRGRGQGAGRGFGAPPNTCKCPACGHSQAKIRGTPCLQVKCPKCGASMIRGD